MLNIEVLLAGFSLLLGQLRFTSYLLTTTYLHIGSNMIISNHLYQTPTAHAAHWVDVCVNQELGLHIAVLVIVWYLRPGHLRSFGCIHCIDFWLNPWNYSINTHYSAITRYFCVPSCWEPLLPLNSPAGLASNINPNGEIMKHRCSKIHPAAAQPREMVRSC